MTRVVPAGKRRRRHRGAPGTAPGTLMPPSESPRPVISLLAYSPEGLEERVLGAGEKIESIPRNGRVIWINVDGLGDEGVLRSLGDAFNMHRLVLEDVVNLGQRTKVEIYRNNVFMVMHMPGSPAGHAEQVSLFLGDGFVLSFQEKQGDCFERVRERIRDGRGRIRSQGPDYLAYALLDAMLDAWFPVLENLHERLEALEERVFASPDAVTMSTLQGLKEELREARRVTTPFREAILSLSRDDMPCVQDETRIYLRDCADHAARIGDMVEVSREVASDLLSAYVSSLSHRLNEVMKVLTIMAAIFIPLSFIAGVYGMNFSADSPWNMPELQWRWGYPGVLLLMAAVAGGMLVYFRRKGWLG